MHLLKFIDRELNIQLNTPFAIVCAKVIQKRFINKYLILACSPFLHSYMN